MTKKAVTLFETHVPAENLTKSLRALAAAGANTDGKAFMKLDKNSGTFMYGPENIEVEDGERWALNQNSFKVGLIGWRGGQCVGEHMYPITSNERVNVDDMEHIPPTTDGSDGWKDQLTFEMKSLDDGTEVLFKTSSKGGMKAAALLAGQITPRMESDPDYAVAELELLVDSYKHKKFGRTYFPVFEVKGWLDQNGNKPGKTKGKRALV